MKRCLAVNRYANPNPNRQPNPITFHNLINSSLILKLPIPKFLANVNVLRYVCYMLSAVRLSSVCLSVCRLSVVCDVGAPYSGG